MSRLAEWWFCFRNGHFLTVKEQFGMKQCVACGHLEEDETATSLFSHERFEDESKE